MTNTAAPVSLIPLGSQGIWAYSELIDRAANETPPTVQDVGVNHGRVLPAGPPARLAARPIRGGDGGAAHEAKSSPSLDSGQAFFLRNLCYQS